jgi:hypothetical protein
MDRAVAAGRNYAGVAACLPCHNFHGLEGPAGHGFVIGKACFAQASGNSIPAAQRTPAPGRRVADDQEAVQRKPWMLLRKTISFPAADVSR